MARRAKKSLSDSDSDVFIPEESGGTAVTRWLLRPLVLLFLVVGVVAYGTFFQGWRLLPDLSGRHEFRVKAEEIHFTDPPAWVPKTFLRQVIREGSLPEEFSLLDDDIVDKVAAAFQKHPWVERVISVRKDFAHRIVVNLEYRKPAAIVNVDSNRYPIDKNAVLLPPPNFPQEADELPLIRHARSAPEDAKVGMAWHDRAVEGAARIAAVVGPTWKKLNLTSIDIPESPSANQKPDDVVYELRAAGGSRILWGRAPGTDHPGELTPAQKLGRLEEYFTRHGGFSDEHGPYKIDIRHWQEITRQLLPERLGKARE